MLTTIVFIRRSMILAMILCFGLSMPIGVSGSTWEIGIIESTGDVGRYCDVQIDTLGNMHVVYVRNDNGSLKLASRASDIWQTPETVDPSGAVEGYCAIAVSAAETRRISYKREDTNALWYAGPESSHEWSIGSVTVSSDDIGKYVSLERHPSGEVSLSCQNATQEALIHMTRDALGVWSSPDTIDPGPNRGQYSDHVYRPGLGYAFSEYDSDQKMLLFADPVIRADEWSIGMVCKEGDSGRFVSLVRAPDGRLASAFYHYDATGLGAVCNAFLVNDAYWKVSTIVDSIAASPNDGVYTDLAITSDWAWHVSYRNAIETFLYCASTDSAIIVTGVGDDEIPTAPPIPNYTFKLCQNFPNPFNPMTIIEYELDRRVPVTLCIYDVGGRLIQQLVETVQGPGLFSERWNGKNLSGEQVSSGIYFYRLKAGKKVLTKKMLLLK